MSALRHLIAAAAAFLLLGLVACGGDDDGEETGSAPGAEECTEVAEPEPKEVDLKRPPRTLERGRKATAIMETSCGTFEIALDTTRSPKTANSFAYLAEEGVYDGTAFHRVAPGFVIQGGDPKGDGTGGPGYSVDEPPPENTVYTRGTVAMAKTAAEPPGRSGSQFFVVTAPADAGLDPDFAVLGRLTGGEEVVARIDALGDPATEQPSQPVVIERVTLERG